MTRRIVITGAFGSGKTSILRELETAGETVVGEPAREILAEQRASGGRGVPEHNPELFVTLMLERAIEGHAEAEGLTFFDRGIPDHIAYGAIFGLDTSAAREAAAARRYDTVFFAPSWPEIYTTDDERKATFEQAHGFGELVRATYEDLGYSITEIPKDSPAIRAEFVRMNA